MPTKKPISVDAYIAEFPKEIQIQLQQLRKIINKAAPEAEEVITYNIPTYKLNGFLLSFAAWKNHIGIYPTPNATGTFRTELKPYEGAKATLKFLYSEPLPIALIKKVVELRIEEAGGKG